VTDQRRAATSVARKPRSSARREELAAVGGDVLRARAKVDRPGRVWPAKVLIEIVIGRCVLRSECREEGCWDKVNLIFRPDLPRRHEHGRRQAVMCVSLRLPSRRDTDCIGLQAPP
jgi:hypothetical protein